MVDLRRQRAGLALDADADRRARRGDRSAQFWQPAEAQALGERRGRRRAGPGAFPELAEHGAHLAERALARLPDVDQRLAYRAVVRRGQHVQCGAGLHRDGRHAVRHRVMQFAGDAQPLLREQPGRLGALFLFSELEPPRRLRGHRAAAADHLAERDGEDEDDERRQEAGEHIDERCAAETDREQAGHHDDRRHGDRQGQVSRHRHVVGRHEHQRGRRDVPAVHQVEEDHGGEGDQQHRARPAPVHEQRQRDDRAERPGQRVERRRARAAAHRHVQFDDRDHDSDRHQVAHADIQRPRLLVHDITVRGRLSPRKAAIPARKFLQKS